MATFSSWNVNGIRACAKNGFVDWIKKNSFDVIGLQEVRAEPSQIPADILDLPDYFKYWMPATCKKGYSGVAILTKVEAKKVTLGLGFDEFDREGRVICAEFKDTYFLSAYFPNSQDKGARIQYKISFCDAIQSKLEKLQKSGKGVILCGDFNIAHKPIDLARPDANHDSPGYLPEERSWMESFLNSGWIDTFRFQNPSKTEAYSWWSARTRARERNIGWRIDYHTVALKDREQIVSTGIQDQVLGSDHCPVTLEYKANL